MRAIILLAAMSLLIAACAGDQAPASKGQTGQTEAFCYSDENQSARHRRQSLCMANEREITQHEFAAWAASQIVPGSGQDIPPMAAFCYDADHLIVYLRDVGGCRWGDYKITEREFVDYLDQKQPPASVRARWSQTP